MVTYGVNPCKAFAAPAAASGVGIRNAAAAFAGGNTALAARLLCIATPRSADFCTFLF